MPRDLGGYEIRFDYSIRIQQAGEKLTKLKVGDRVVLISKKYELRANNPRICSKGNVIVGQVVVGTVMRIRRGIYGQLEQMPINVNWENGTNNVYEEIDLDCLSHPKIGDKIKDTRTNDIGTVTKQEGEKVWAKWDKDNMEFYIHMDDTEKILMGGIV